MTLSTVGKSVPRVDALEKVIGSAKYCIDMKLSGMLYGKAPTFSSAVVRVAEDGTVEVRHSVDEIGQGANTVLAQIAAEEFGIPVNEVKIVRGDTAITPFDEGVGSSRATYNTGNAVRLACLDAQKKLLQLAAERLESPPEELETKGGRVLVKDAPEAGITISSLFSPAFGEVGYQRNEGEIVGHGAWYQDYVPEDLETGQIDPVRAASGGRLNAFYTHGAQAV